MDQFERGVHPDQQQVPDAPLAPSMPRYSHSINELAVLLHNIELSQRAGLPNMYYNTHYLLYTEAMDYRESFPPLTFASLYPTQEAWDA
ncbi:hypothetical protein A2U01_0071932, partial [Trifolium medium]|nr:hypothetical protein [Trifolium medium]